MSTNPSENLVKVVTPESLWRAHQADHRVGKELARDASTLGLPTRICAEMGAHFVKTYFASKVLPGSLQAVRFLWSSRGKKLPELDA